MWLKIGTKPLRSATRFNLATPTGQSKKIHQIRETVIGHKPQRKQSDKRQRGNIPFIQFLRGWKW
jgi:hypothetical protein